MSWRLNRRQYSYSENSKNGRSGSFDKPILIGPSDQNIIKGPLLDAARMNQSFSGKCELLIAQHDEVSSRGEISVFYINFEQITSEKYSVFRQYLYKEIFLRLISKSEIESISFYTGILFARILSPRVLIHEKSALKYFAVSLQFLNNFARTSNV
jgi:hypothetical protein